LLARHGLQSPLPDAVAPREVRGRLWELVYALAALGHHFLRTDHLTDGEFYRWLHEEWLPGEAEAGAEAGPVMVVGPRRCPELWLACYATEEERAAWAVNCPQPTLPARVVPGQPRDIWLPRPREFSGVEGITEWQDSEPGAPNILKLDLGAEELGQCDTKRWEHPAEELRRQGVRVLPPDEVTDAALPAVAWELFHELACRGFYLLHTDHLTDRELYVALWREGLRRPAVLPGRCWNGGWYHDFAAAGFCRRPSAGVWLKYYATEEERRAWVEAEPGVGMLPEAETPPSRRDWRLPKGPL
jgi:hypothetical protein